MARDKLVRLCSYAGELIDVISANEDEYALREASLELVRLFFDPHTVWS